MYKEQEAFLAAWDDSMVCTGVVGNAAQWAAEIIDELGKEYKENA